MSEMVRCAICKYVGKGRIPRGGDGSALVPYPHKRWQSGWGDPGFGVPGNTVWCEGRLEVAEIVKPWAETVAGPEDS